MSIRMFNSVADNRMKLPSFLTSALSTKFITRAPREPCCPATQPATERNKQFGLWTFDPNRNLPRGARTHDELMKHYRGVLEIDRPNSRQQESIRIGTKAPPAEARCSAATGHARHVAQLGVVDDDQCPEFGGKGRGSATDGID
jgi:hypothetical protein